MQYKLHYSWLAITYSALLLGCSPQEKTKEQQAPISDDYQWDQPESFSMPEKLLEISGIAFHEGNPNTIFAIQDEVGEVYTINWNDTKSAQTKFEKKGDYEDISILNNQIYILRSDGTLYQFPYEDLQKEETRQTKQTSLLPEGEYEGMFGDEKTGLIYVLCKECKQDRENVSGYILSTKDGIKLSGTFQVDVAQIEEKAGKIKKGFRPSALAKNPVTGEWYILSSANKLLVIADSNWKIIKTTALDAQMHSQPEGIAFDTEGNLYISNEGKNKHPGNILRFDRK